MKNLAIKIICTLFIISIMLVGCVDYDTGEYDERVEELRLLAEQGNIDAQVDLAEIYMLYGDNAQVVYWYRRAAEQGYAMAQYNLGVYYESGLRGVAQDYEQAVYWYRKAAEQGFAMAQSNLGLMYFQGNGVIQNYEQAVHWLKSAAEQDEPAAQNNIGWMYHNGWGVEQSYEQAAYWYRKAIAQGNLRAQANLAALPAQYR